VLALVFDNDEGEADLAYVDGALQDSGLDLETAVLLSLHCDAPALDGDVLPVGTPLRGWWGDDFDDDGAGPMGSRLWLLDDAAVSEATASRARTYAKEAMAWLVKDGHVREVDALTVVGDEAIQLIPVVRLKNGDEIRFSPLQVGAA